MHTSKKEYMKAYRLKNKEKLKEQQREYHKKYYQEKKEEIKQKSKDYYEKNKDGKIKEYKEKTEVTRKKYQEEYNKNYRNGEKREELLEKKREYHWKNREKILEKKNEYSKRPEVKKRVNKTKKEKYTNDINYKLRTLIRSRLRLAIKDKQKTGSAIENLGCSVDELIVYLENKFEDGMTWEKHTLNGWHIDHIKPLCQFDLEDPKQFAEACHYTNLQPLWCSDNYSKGGRTD
jgi:hypothetical protein